MENLQSALYAVCAEGDVADRSDGKAFFLRLGTQRHTGLAIVGARCRSRTGMAVASQGILSQLCQVLKISRHFTLFRRHR